MSDSNTPAEAIRGTGFSVWKWLQAGLAVMVLAYLSVRLFTVPFTIDEAITFAQFVSRGRWWPEPTFFNANNHMLNTLLAIWSCKLFGLNEFALRLPSFLAAFVYVFYASAWSRRLTSAWSRLTLFVALVSPHFLLDFFGLSRGYGLSMALILACWFHLGRWWQQAHTKDLFALLLFGALATFANLSLLMPYLVCLGIVAMGLLSDAFQTRAYRIGQWLMVVALGITPVYFLSRAAFLLKDGGHLFYGAGYGFWNVTAQSLIVAVFGRLEEMMVYIVPVALIAAWVLLLLAWFRSGQLLWRTDGAFLLVLMVVSVVGHVMMNLLLNVNFPSDRVALYLVPLSALVMVFAVESSRADDASRKLAVVLPAVLWAIPLSSLSMVNLSYTSLWKWDSGAKAFFSHINDSKHELGFQPTVAVSELQAHSLAFHNTMAGQPLSSIHTHLHGSHITDFVLSSPEIASRPELAEYYPVLQHEASGTTLLRRRTLRQRVLVLSNEVSHSVETAEFTVFFAQALDTLEGKDLLIEVSFDLIGSLQDWNMHHVLDVYDESGANQGYWMMPLEVPWQQDGNQVSISKQFIVPGSIRPIHHTKLYLWNVGQQPVDISNIQVQIWWLRG